MDECTALFEERVDEFARAGVWIDMGHWFQCYAFDVIGQITYSKSFGFLDQGEDITNAIAALHNTMVYNTLIGI